MTIEEITSRVKQHTYGLLNDGEVVYAVEMALQSHGGIDPGDIESVRVGVGNSSIDIQFKVREGATFIDMAGGSDETIVSPS
jgi:hypothetical protein